MWISRLSAGRFAADYIKNEFGTVIIDAAKFGAEFMKNNTQFIEQLDLEGFFVWPSLLPSDLIDQHLDAYAALNASMGVKPGESFYSYPSEKQAAIRQSRSDFHAENIDAQKMIFNRELMGFLRDYFGDEPVMRGP